jgi:hypothetical protein
LVARSARDDFSNQPEILFDGHMFNETVVIDEEKTVLGIFPELLILG